MGEPVPSLVLSLLMTEVIECALALLLGKHGKALLLCALVNLVTNPAVVMLHFLSGGGWMPTVLLEAAAVLTEGGFYRYSGLYRRPFLFTLAANGISFLAGLLLSRLF